jgi:hypothetical protein
MILKIFLSVSRTDFSDSPPAHHRSRDVSAHRLGKVLMDEAELNRDWIAATPPDVVFREPKD